MGPVVGEAKPCARCRVRVRCGLTQPLTPVLPTRAPVNLACTLETRAPEARGLDGAGVGDGEKPRGTYRNVY